MPDDTIMYCATLKDFQSNIRNEYVSGNNTVIQIDSEESIIDIRSIRKKCFVLMNLCVIDFIIILIHCFFVEYFLCLFAINSIVGFFGAYYKSPAPICFYCVVMFLELLCVISIFWNNIDHHDITTYLFKIIVPFFHLIFDCITFSHSFLLLKELDQ